MTALIYTRRLGKKDGKHVHPKTGELLDLGEGDFFSLWIEGTKVEPGKEEEPLLSMVLARTTMEQVCDGMQKALTTHPVRIRRA